MVWLGACSRGITLLVILDEGTVDHSCYIKNVLPVALKYGNEEVFGDNWTYQQNGANSHRHQLTQEWVYFNNFPSFIEKDGWPPNSPSRFESSV